MSWYEISWGKFSVLSRTETESEVISALMGWQFYAQLLWSATCCLTAFCVELRENLTLGLFSVCEETVKSQLREFLLDILF